MPFKKSSEEKKNDQPNVPSLMMMQSAAAAFAAKAGVDVSSSSDAFDAFSDDSSPAVSLRIDNDSDDGEEYYVSPFESSQEECT